jgi:hypothetical protein
MVPGLSRFPLGCRLLPFWLSRIKRSKRRKKSSDLLVLCCFITDDLRGEKCGKNAPKNGIFGLIWRYQVL